MQTKYFIRPLAVTALVLLIPIFANHRIEGWNWTSFDFVFAFVLLFGSGLAYEIISRKSSGAAYRTAVGLAVLAAFLLVWVNGAVGIIGSEDSPVNLMYFGVILTGFIGAAIARFKPEGMARAMFAATLAQLAVPVIALAVWQPNFSPGVAQVFALNAVFAMLWAGSALLFRASAQDSERGRQLA